MKKRKRAWCCAALAALMLFGVACGGGQTPSPETDGSTSSEQPTDAPTDEGTTGGGTADQKPNETYDPPVIWDFSSESAMRASGVSLFKTSTDGGFVPHGVYGFTTVGDTKVLSLSHELYLTAGSTFPAYRVMLSAVASTNKLKKDYCWIRVTYRTTDDVSSAFKLLNNATGEVFTLFTTETSKGNDFVTSAPVSLENCADIWTRILGYKPLTIGYDSLISNSDFCIKEIAFFNSEKAAYAYYGDSAEDTSAPVAMTFGSSGNSAFYAGSDAYTGIYSVSEEDSSVVLGYAPATAMATYGDYCFMAKFKTSGVITSEYKYVRVLYSAKNPSGVSGALFSIRSNANPGGDYVGISGITDTNGKFVLSNSARMKAALVSRLSSGMHCSMLFSAKGDGADYRVKALYFFKTKAEADAFEAPSDTKSTVTINGQALSKYSIVLPSNAVTRETNAAEALQGYFYRTSGVRLPIVVDTEQAAGDYEILMGLTNREESRAAYAGYLSGETAYAAYDVSSVGNKLVFAYFYNPAIEKLIPLFAKYYLRSNDLQRPASIDIQNCAISARLALTEYTGWGDEETVNDPDVFTDDFSSGSTWWLEEGTNDAWHAANGAYTSSGSGYELTYLHVYEKNAVISADLRAIASAAGKGSFGLQLRYTSEYGYVRGGYDFVTGCWYIETREGEDFTAIRVASKSATLTAGQVYRLTLTAENGTVKLAVDGEEILSGSVTQITPGRIAVYAYDVAVTLDNVRVDFTSGSEGHIISGIIHTVLPGNAYMEGGSVIELGDGKLHYIHHSGAAYSSSDNGASWESETSWYSGSYASVFRLQNGDLIKTVYGNGEVACYTSTDEGKTWTKTGKICASTYEGSVGLNAGNMNDKMFQSKSGRLLYVQGYENQTATEFIEGQNVRVCCAIYYSDNNGASWTRSKTTTFTMPGNGGQLYSGEGKIIECADGSLRYLATWTQFDRMIWSESTDGGVTWGAIHEMEGFECSRSSMAIMRDPNGPTDYTYYMVWCYGEMQDDLQDGMPRSRLALAYSTDGKNWSYLGDVWWWESNWRYDSESLVNHIVDPFIYVTETHVIIGTGICERTPYDDESGVVTYHQAQRQHIWSVEKDALSAYDEWPQP